MRKFIISALLVLPLSHFAAAQDSTVNPSGPAQKSQLNLKETATQLMLTNDSFVKKAAIASRAEVEMAKLAMVKSKDPQIQSFAQRMVKDHVAASTELESIAQSKNIPLPTELDHSHKSATEKLSKLSGTDFDAAFSKQMQEDHDKAVTLFTAAADDKKLDPQLQQFAAKTLPVLREHQHAAHGLSEAEHVSSN
jgi:putative membrane protein